MGNPRSVVRTDRWLGCVLAVSVLSCAHEPPRVERVVLVAPAAPAPIAPVVIPVLDSSRIVRPEGQGASPVFSVEADRVNVYFNDGAGRLWYAPKDGSARATALVDDEDESVRSFVVGGDVVYYAGRRGIRSVSTRGGASTTLSDNNAGPVLLVSDGRSIYHTVFDGSAIYRLSLATHHAERFYPGGKHQTLAVDANNLYVASYMGGTITAVSKSTRHARVLAVGVRRPVRLAVDGSYVYFTSEVDGTVRRVGKHGGRVEVIARGQHEQEHLALDAGYVYWATRTPDGEHAVVRAAIAPIGSGLPEQLYSGMRSAAGIAVDERFVYVADRGAGEVLRIAKTKD
jgi:Domain of unknown function (DUF5050)